MNHYIEKCTKIVNETILSPWESFKDIEDAELLNGTDILRYPSGNERRLSVLWHQIAESNFPYPCYQDMFNYLIERFFLRDNVKVDYNGGIHVSLLFEDAIEIIIPKKNGNDNHIHIHYYCFDPNVPPQKIELTGPQKQCLKLAELMEEKRPLGQQLAVRAPSMKPWARYAAYFLKWRKKDKRERRDAQYYKDTIREIEEKNERYYINETKKFQDQYNQCKNATKHFYEEYYDFIKAFAGDIYTIDTSIMHE